MPKIVTRSNPRAPQNPSPSPMAPGERSPAPSAAPAEGDFVLRSGVRVGLKREFAFALHSQAALASSPLGRTRSRRPPPSSAAADAAGGCGPSRKSKRPKRSAPAPEGDARPASPPPLVEPLRMVVSEACMANLISSGALELGSGGSGQKSSDRAEAVLENGDLAVSSPVGKKAPPLAEKAVVSSPGKASEAFASSPVGENATPLVESRRSDVATGDGNSDQMMIVPPEKAVEETVMAGSPRVEKAVTGECNADEMVVVPPEQPSEVNVSSPNVAMAPLLDSEEKGIKRPMEAIGSSPIGEPPKPLFDSEEIVIIPPEMPPRRITRSMVVKPPLIAKKLVPEDSQPPANGDSGVVEEEKPVRRFTRSLLKDRGEESGTTTVSNSSSGSADGSSGASPKSPKKKMELKMSKKISPTKIPGNVRELLATGLLEGLPVKYVMKKGKRPALRGVIKGTGILCSCSSCKGRTVVSPYYFELHAGSGKKHPSDYIFLENGSSLHGVLGACANASLDTLEYAVQNAIGPAPQKRAFSCQTCKRSFRTSRTGKFASLCDSCLDSNQPQHSIKTPKTCRLPSSPAKGSKNASSGEKNTTAGRLTRKDVGLHKLVFMSGVLPEGTEVGYFVGGKRLLNGYIKDLGIYCHCCDAVVSPSQFEAHAGRAARRKPYHNIYMSNGVSLHELSVSLSKGRKMATSQTDDLCSICADGGKLLLCDLCPRAFHIECIGLSAVPKGTWYCRYCQNRHQRESSLAYNNNAIAAGRIAGVDPMEQIFTRSTRVATTPEDGFGGCALCKLHDFSKMKFSDRTVLLCDQCGREYHVGCLRENKMADLKALPKGAWYCSPDCSRIRDTLEDLLHRGAEPVPVVDVEIIKKKHEEKGLNKDDDIDVRWRLFKGKSSADSKLVLSKAVTIFHESFDPIVQVTTGRDLIPAMVYGRSLRDQDYTGMYCAVLTVGDSVVSAGLFRIMGSEIAELPLVATGRESQGLGYFQSLFACIERLLVSLKVKHFVLPAAKEAESIWTKRFGFTRINLDQLREYLKGGRTTIFHGTSTLHKLLPNC